MYIKLGILYATEEGSFSRDKSRAVYFSTDQEVIEYLVYHNIADCFAFLDLMHVVEV